ncbi:MAG TPA: O-antigen ligase family protein [Verrucomicrobiae bacterium]|nr:O-antigen ligase family protein [Verrucomicrobiae bacterium]
MLLAYVPYAKGLFFQQEWYYVHIFSACLVILALVLRSKHLGFFHRKLDLLVIGFVLTYLVSAPTAVNAKAAMTEAMKQVNFLAVYWLVLYGGWKDRDISFLPVALFWSGAGVAALGLTSALGIYELQGGYVESRIYSTLQYPNTLAAYLGCLVFFGIHLWSESRSWLRRFYLPALYLMTVCLIGTGSRGGIGVFVILIPAFLWLVPQKFRKDYGFRLFTSFGLGVVFAPVILRLMEKQNMTQAGIALVVGLVLSFCLESLPLRLVTVSRKHLIIVTLIAIALLGTGYIITAGGENPLSRLRTISLKASEFRTRLSYYQDGLEMTLERPLTGYGGGGWSLYSRYQEYPYFVSDPDNQLIKVAVETGALGVAFYIALWIGLAITVWRVRRTGRVKEVAIFSGLSVIGLHSLIDFDLSYGAMGLLFWVGAALLQFKQRPTGLQFKMKQRVLTALCAGGIALWLGVMSVSLLQAIEQEGWGKFYLERSRNAEGFARLEQAEKMDPFDARFSLTRAEVYYAAQDLTAARSEVDHALKLDSTNAAARGLASKIYLASGQLTEAQALAEDQLAFHPVEGNAYLETAQFYAGLADKALQQGEKAKAKQYLLQGAKLAERLQKKLDEIPEWEAPLWIEGKQPVPAELIKKSQELEQRASKLG